jgi:Sporulation protein Cse60
MAKTVIQTKVIFGKEKDMFEDSLNHFLTSIEQDNFVDIKFEENQGMYSALVVFRIKRS